MHVDLLFGEHVFVVAKLAMAALAGRKDEFRAYAGLLAANSADVTTLMQSAVGDTAGSQFGQAWTEGNNLYVDYIVAASIRNQAKANVARASLMDTYVPLMAKAVSESLPLPVAQATQAAADQVSYLLSVVDYAVASQFAAGYHDVRGTYALEVRWGDMVAEAVVRNFADRFPGSVVSKAANFRAALDTLLQGQAYLMTMATQATVVGTQTEQQAAAGVVAENSGALRSEYGSVFGEAKAATFGDTWVAESSFVVAYAKSGDMADRQGAIAAAPTLSTELQAILQVVDDQRAKSFDKLASDDHAAAVMLAAAGDAISATT